MVQYIFKNSITKMSAGWSVKHVIAQEFPGQVNPQKMMAVPEDFGYYFQRLYNEIHEGGEYQVFNPYQYEFRCGSWRVLWLSLFNATFVNAFALSLHIKRSKFRLEVLQSLLDIAQGALKKQAAPTSRPEPTPVVSIPQVSAPVMPIAHVPPPGTSMMETPCPVCFPLQVAALAISTPMPCRYVSHLTQQRHLFHPRC
jgi:hypothetical protein